jgi:excisionase family DNA binding protein
MLPEQEPLLTASEVADYFHVDPKTVTRWAKKGLIRNIRTAGGHRRYPESEVLRIANRETEANSGS